ncbi:MAG: N-glycosylase/DNA lyase [Pyrinomonadaceae bacterium]|nr:N-glycosylase/DNA lyase [Pyrinomonadaceae bacterium]
MREHQPVTVESIRSTHKARRKEIRARLGEFEKVWRDGSNARLWEELVFCIFTAGASARMGLKSIEAVRPLLWNGRGAEMTEALKKAGAHRFPVSRPEYIVIARQYLREHCGLRLREQLESFSDPIERRDWLAREKRIKGLGYKEASHFLRNIGLMGHAILDKHVLRCLADLEIVESSRPPSTKARYLEIEERLKGVARDVRIDFDELDLVLWSMKTGEVLK